MKKDKIILFISIIILFVVIAIIGLSIGEEKVNEIDLFIETYESYNGEELYDHEVLDLDLNEDAIIYITTVDEIVDIMGNEDALIYFGFETCPWCRNMITALLDAAAAKDQPIYYVNIQEVRNVYTVEEGLLIESTIGEDAYYEILEYLDDVLSDYYVYDEDGEEYNTETKRLYGPTVITVKDGALLDIYENTHEDVEDPYTELTEEQYDELLTEYKNMINDLQNMACTLENC